MHANSLLETECSNFYRVPLLFKYILLAYHLMLVKHSETASLYGFREDNLGSSFDEEEENGEVSFEIPIEKTFICCFKFVVTHSCPDCSKIYSSISGWFKVTSFKETSNI